MPGIVADAHAAPPRVMGLPSGPMDHEALCGSPGNVPSGTGTPERP